MSDQSLPNSPKRLAPDSHKGQRRGEKFALLMTLIEAWFPIFASFSAVALGGLFAYFYSLIVAVLFLGLWLIYKKKTQQVFYTKAYKNLFLTSLFITSLFALIFVGLQYTSATNVAIIMFLQILFGFAFLGRKPGESLTRTHVLGALLMTCGALLILFPGEVKVNFGDFLVLLAAIIAPFANLYQKKARAQVSSETILFVRSLVALPFIYILALIFENTPTIELLLANVWWLFLTGFLVFFISKILWIEAIYLLPITKVNALYAFAPLLTMGLAYFLLNEVPTFYQMLGVFPVLVGSVLITQKIK